MVSDGARVTERYPTLAAHLVVLNGAPLILIQTGNLILTLTLTLTLTRILILHRTWAWPGLPIHVPALAIMASRGARVTVRYPILAAHWVVLSRAATRPTDVVDEYVPKDLVEAKVEV